MISKASDRALLVSRAVKHTILLLVCVFAYVYVCVRTHTQPHTHTHTQDDSHLLFAPPSQLHSLCNPVQNSVKYKTNIQIARYLKKQKNPPLLLAPPCGVRLLWRQIRWRQP